LFAQLPEAKVRGYHPRRFSFNKPGGRCEACEGNGQKKIEMHFLPDVWVECDVCHGKRYNPETLAVHYKGRSIADVLEMRVAEALELFANIPKIRGVLQTLADVGLDYLSLGQPAPTLSGGEAQRVKLAAELGRPNTGRTVYLLNKPTGRSRRARTAELLIRLPFLPAFLPLVLTSGGKNMIPTPSKCGAQAIWTWSKLARTPKCPGRRTAKTGTPSSV